MISLIQPKQQSLLKIEDEQNNQERESFPSEPSTVINKEKPPRVTVPSGPTGTWTNLKIKLNNFQTRAPLFCMAVKMCPNDSQKMFQEAKKLNSFHKETTNKIAKELWPEQNIPAAAIAIIGKGIADSMQNIWRENSTEPKMTSDKTAALYLQFMPDINENIEDIFSNDNHIPHSVLIEAKTGVKLAVTLAQTVGNEPDALHQFYLNKIDIPELVQKLNTNIQEKSKAISESFSSPDELHRNVAFQSTLKTLGTVYEQGIQLAFREIQETIYSHKEKTNQEKRQYIEKSATFPSGQLYEKTTNKVNQLIAAIYMEKLPEKKTDQINDSRPGMR